MQIEMDVPRLSERARRCGSNLRRLCSLAGIAPSTLYRSVGGKVDHRLSTLQKLNTVLQALERDAAMALIRLHPDLAHPDIIPSAAGLPSSRPGGGVGTVAVSTTSSPGGERGDRAQPSLSQTSWAPSRGAA